MITCHRMLMDCYIEGAFDAEDDQHLDLNQPETPMVIPFLPLTAKDNWIFARRPLHKRGGTKGAMMAEYDYDLITIGAGSGGVRASRIAAAHGARVAIIEEDRPGGTCVLRGCVPKKLLVFGAAFSAEVEDATGFGWDTGQPDDWGHDWGQLISRKNAELDRLSGIYTSLLENAGVEIIAGRGVVRDAHTVAVAGRELTAERLLIAVGGWPSMPPIPGLAEHAISSNEALELSYRPDEVVVFGSGYMLLNLPGFLMVLVRGRILSIVLICRYGALMKISAPPMPRLLKPGESSCIRERASARSALMIQKSHHA